ncbi:MAG: cupin domain-containing protein [Vicinamibacteria bacterium]
MKPQDDLRFDKLGELLGVDDTRDFFERVWEKAPGLFRGKTSSARSSFLRADWRELAREVSALADGVVEVIVDGRPQKPRSDAAIDEAFAAGGSVRVFKAERVWPFLRTLLSDLELETGFRFGANLYVTPAEQQGLGHHSDSHDVFVVQMSGTKRWEIFDSPYPLPVGHRASLVFEDGTRRDHRGDEFGGRVYPQKLLGAPEMELTLQAGDLLYIPRGFVHRAFTAEGVSAHVTIGCHATTWGDLLALSAAQETRRAPGLRETLPPGAFRRALPKAFVETELRSRASGLWEHLHGDGLMLEAAARFGAAMTPASESEKQATPPDPRPAETETVSLLRLAPRAYVSIGPLSVEARSLAIPARIQAFPLSFKPVFESLLRGQVVSHNDFPAVTQRGREVLTARLIRQGLLVPAKESAPGRR